MSETPTPPAADGCEIKDRCRKAERVGCQTCGRNLPRPTPAPMPPG